MDNKENKEKESIILPKRIFTESEKSMKYSVLLVWLCDVGIFVMAVCGISGFISDGRLTGWVREYITADVLIGLCNFAMTTVLSIAAIGIGVFQHDTKAEEENKKEIYRRYIFGLFPTIGMIVFGYLVALFCHEYPTPICVYSALMLARVTVTIMNTMASFRKFFSI